jgi:hypothetical protein
VVRLFLWWTGDAKAEEALVAGFAAIGTLKQQIVTDKFLGAPSQRAVNSVATAIRATGKVLLRCGFVHGKLLSDKVGVFDDRGTLYYNV